MGLLFDFFKKKSIAVNDSSKSNIQIPEYLELIDFKKKIDTLLSKKAYIAKSEYKDEIYALEKTVEYFESLQKGELLEIFCKKNRIDYMDIKNILFCYKNIESLVKEHNDSYIKSMMIDEKDYLDNILKDIDPNIILDEDQKRVVLTDEDYCLVIAGAGAGKTTTVAAKVKYLVEKKKVLPSQILVVSFTNKAVLELREKVNKDLKIDCPITTFHSAGNAILRKESQEPLNIISDSKLYYVLQDYFKRSLLKKESLVNNLILFFGSYFDTPYEGNDLNCFFNKIAKSNFATMRSDLDEFRKQIIDVRTRQVVTIQNEVLRSYEEVEIANFLYLNQIEYEYEPIYKYNTQYAKKPYTPDFKIYQEGRVAYIEHFGITEDGRNDRYTKEEIETYKKAIRHKIALHKQHGTELIYTFSKYLDNRSLLEHLKEELEKKGFTIVPRSNKEVLEKIVSSEENRYIRKLLNLICRFITNFKINGFRVDEFSVMYHSTQNVRTQLFLSICHDCYLEYQRYLKENHAVDFQDMINESARILQEVKDFGQKLDFKYIIVDEYQDISRQRFDLVKALSEVTKAKIVAVGDDWQSIYAFSGSDITLFTKFQEKMGYAALLKIVKTYRNSQEVIDIAGNFIQKNNTQIKKELKSPKNITNPVIIYTYDGSYKKVLDNNKSGANYALAHAVEVALEQIIEFNKLEGKPNDSSILLLGRFGFDCDRLEKSGLFEYINHGNKLKSVKYPYLNITFMTAHASKGLGYDNVILINCKNETYGFPSKIEDDPVLNFVIKGDSSIDYAEERRLFYVAMTRTKNRVYFIAPEQNPSEFLLEIKKDYKNVVLNGNWNENQTQNDLFKKTCPICGYPMQFRYKNSYGLRLFLCTNEPEICGFMTNEYGAGKLSILKCDACQDGYLIVKKTKNNDYFLGCTNYKNDGTGCNRTLWKEQYYEMMNLSLETNGNKQAEMNRNITLSHNQNHMAGDVVYPIKKAKINPVMYDGKDLNEAIYTILQCLSRISEKHFYNASILVDILSGITNKQVIEANLDKVFEYGKLKCYSRKELYDMIDWLIENHFILKTKHSKYPVLHPTYNGIHYDETMTSIKLKKLCQLLQNKIELL